MPGVPTEGEPNDSDPLTLQGKLKILVFVFLLCFYIRKFLILKCCNPGLYPYLLEGKVVAYCIFQSYGKR